MSKVGEVYTAEDVLQWEDSRLIDFVEKCPRKGRLLDISQVQGVDELSTTQLLQLDQKLSAAQVKLGTTLLDADDLVARLAKEPAQVGSCDFDTENEEWATRSSTESLPRPNRTGFEIFCFDELTETDGRPAWSLLMLSDSTPNDERERQIAMWASEEYRPDSVDDPPLVLSGQLKDWNEFRHKWQWNNRGMHAGEEGFNEHLAWSRRRDHFFDRRHTSQWVEAARYSWDREQKHLDIEGHVGQGLDDYASAVQTRLVEHKFYEPFQLAQNPREQDIWTTWVEYLCYLYYRQDHYADIMTRLEDEHTNAWKDFDKSLWRLDANNPSNFPEQQAMAKHPALEIAELKTRLNGTKDAIHKFFQATREYRRNEKLWGKQKKRAAWAREQIAAIATEQEKKAAEARADVAASTAAAAGTPNDKRKEKGKRKRSGQVDEARLVSKKAKKGAKEQSRGLVTTEKQKRDESGATRRSSRLASGKTRKAAPRS